MTTIPPLGNDPMDQFSEIIDSAPLITADGTVVGQKYTKRRRENLEKPGRTLAVTWDSRKPLPDDGFTPVYSYLVRFSKTAGQEAIPAGMHYHAKKNELFMAAYGEFLVVLEDRDTKQQVSITLSSDTRNTEGEAIEEVIYVPANTAHAVLPLWDGQSSFSVIADYPEAKSDEFAYEMNITLPESEA